MNNLKHSAQRIQVLLDSLAIPTQVIEFKEPIRTAQEAANTIGCSIGQIVKTLLFKRKIDSTPLCVLVSGQNRVDEAQIANLIGSPIEKPNAQYVLEHTGFAIGGIPPIGYSLDSKPLIDEDLLQFSEVWAVAGTPHAVFKIAIEDLLRITQAIVANLKV